MNNIVLFIFFSIFVFFMAAGLFVYAMYLWKEMDEKALAAAVTALIVFAVFFCEYILVGGFLS